MKSDINGTYYKNSSFFSKYPNAFRINLYCDEIEVVNALGSKTNRHKITMFYYTILNFPTHFNSNLKNIFVSTIAYSMDVQQYGFKEVLKPLITELNILASEKSCKLKLKNGEIFTLRAALVCVSGDSLAIHDIFGLLGPGCKYFCRCCMISRLELHNDGNQTRYIKRTKDLHGYHLKSIEENSMTSSDCGVMKNSALNEISNFHTTTNFAFDFMHDLLEGIVGLEIIYVLRYFIKDRNLFTIDHLNQRIEKFRYGAVEEKNKPVNNFATNHIYSNTKNIKQRAIQTWVLLRSLPFLIGHLIPNECHEYMRLLMLLQKILEIVTSHEVTDFILVELEHLILYHENLYRKLFGNVFINKHHHLRHYVECFNDKGPLIQYGCLRFEAKHLEVKRIIQNSKNFINIPLTVAKRLSFKQNIHINRQTYSKYNMK